ncbi:hypothetical protein TRIUR3_04148 [Triticum urartu]|uniref:Proline-rich protein PRCC n=1 Tax=Triticum urartu TaxID=4572 RepID=M7Z3X1_TRIUA|nr:hypothetical protein TRIUR3_04148 [Triticum urartu]
MDSLLATYASSDEDADESIPTPAPATRRSEASGKPAGSIFSALPQPKSAPIFSSLPAPKSAPTFSSIPPPKSSASSGTPKRVVQFRPPPIRQTTGVSSDEEDDAEKRRAPERSDTGPADEDDPEESSDEDGMPAPEQQQEQQDLGAGAGDVQHQGYDAGVGNANGYEGYAWDPNYYAYYGLDPNSNLNYGAEPQYAAYGVEQGGGYANGYGGEHSGGYEHSTAPPCGGEYTGGYSAEAVAMAAPPMPEPALPPELGRIGVKRGRRDMPMEIIEVNQAELVKNRPREDKSKLTGMAFGPSYQSPPSICCLSSLPDLCDLAARSMWCRRSSRHVVDERLFVQPPSHDASLRRPQARWAPLSLVKYRFDLGENHPGTDFVRVGYFYRMNIAALFDITRCSNAAPSGKGKPSKLQKRKHQIGSLFYDLKQKEMELTERRAKGFLTKAETQAKYGW